MTAEACRLHIKLAMWITIIWFADSHNLFHPHWLMYVPIIVLALPHFAAFVLRFVWAVVTLMS